MGTDEDLLLELSEDVEKFKKWISQNFSAEQITDGTIDDAGYPEWNKVENLLQKIFAAIEFKNLNDWHLDNLIYMIARNWDRGTILNWLRQDDKLSQLGMTEDQFLIIAKRGVNSVEWDARYQISGLLHRLSKKDEALEFALTYYEDEEEFVRRKALTSLFKLGYPNLAELLEKSWLNNEEYERMLCLYLWKETNNEKYLVHLEESLWDERIVLKKYAESLKKGKTEEGDFAI